MFLEKFGRRINDEDAVKFANLYFIHTFFLSVVDTVVIPQIYFNFVESDRYSDYPWGNVAFEELAKSLNKKLKPKEIFYMLHGMPLAIQVWLYECCFTISCNAASKVDKKIPLLLNWKTNASRPRYESLIESIFDDADNKKKLKQQHKGLDEQSLKRTPPPCVAKNLSIRTPIFKPIQPKDKLASKRKDINRPASKKSSLIQSPDLFLSNSEDEDVVVTKKVT
ncbi:hypothetical protein BC332_13891 [Capsicum chinense]|nr:hypothetical protein BC332_13891 [Capsicum chinense]